MADQFDGIWTWIGTAVSAVFGGGIVWGASRAQIAEHASRLIEHTEKIAALEATTAATREVVASLPTKADLHAQTVQLQSQSTQLQAQMHSGFDTITRIITRRD